jgi:hypothetical protein
MHLPVIWGFIKPPWHSCARNLRIPKTYTPWRCQKSEDNICMCQKCEDLPNLQGMHGPEIWEFTKPTQHACARDLSYIKIDQEETNLQKERMNASPPQNHVLSSLPHSWLSATENDSKLQRKTPPCLSVSLYPCPCLSSLKNSLF